VGIQRGQTGVKLITNAAAFPNEKLQTGAVS